MYRLCGPSAGALRSTVDAVRDSRFIHRAALMGIALRPAESSEVDGKLPHGFFTFSPKGSRESLEAQA